MKQKSNHSDVRINHHYKKYRCVHCLEPCTSLYTTYGNKNSTSSSPGVEELSQNSSTNNSTLKLNHCSVCLQIVDPYCEREWLLIFVDLLLLRQEAYRHVLCNNTTISNNTTTINDGNRSNLIHFIKTIWKDLVLCCLLNVYHKYQSIGDYTESITNFIVSDNSLDPDVSTKFITEAVMIFSSYFILYLCGWILFIGIIVLFGTYTTKTIQGDKTKSYTQQQGYSIMLLKSVLWPSLACQIATCWVEIWENSDTTRLLGCTIFQLLYQWIALYQTFLARRTSTSTGNIHNKTTNRRLVLSTAVMTTSIVLAATVIRSSVLIFLGSKSQEAGIDVSMSCSGLEWSIAIFRNGQYTICLA